MNGFFFDENLPAKILFTPSLPIIFREKSKGYGNLAMCKG